MGTDRVSCGQQRWPPSACAVETEASLIQRSWNHRQYNVAANDRRVVYTLQSRSNPAIHIDRNASIVVDTGGSPVG